ncbi:MAG: NAD(P)-dependent oxidoreductase [Solirubrobacterales bacterium]|jgi:3-hydroxyisobutyrate dehydrogenase-like beta-hydroxyacid dehydrogenase|nr:NAD(P)-dependent oxidoreductase [Solirubrobacterales bacterium]
MQDGDLAGRRLGWVGTGRMGYSLARRLLEAGCDVAAYNRTRAKAEPLREFGATVVDSPAELADREIVFTMVAGSEDFKQVVVGPSGLLSTPATSPQIIVDLTTVSPEASAQVRSQLAERDVALLAAPVSGNPKVVDAGLLTIVVSGPAAAYEQVSPYLELLGQGATYVGEGERARLAKICHNLLLGVVAQSLAEITVLAEKGGIARADLLEFINRSVMGSMFSRYKTPAFVKLDYSPTFTPVLLRKDFDLGFDLADELGVPMPVAAAARELVQALIAQGRTEEDFAALLDQQARSSGVELEPEDAEVSDGLGELAAATRTTAGSDR